MTGILIFIGIVIVAFFLYSAFTDYRFEKDNMKAFEMLHEIERQNRVAAIKEEENYKELYGTCTKSLCKDENQRYAIHVFEESQTIIINGQPYKFGDIIGCEGSSIPREEVTLTTTTDTGNMAVRAAVGGALFGTSGAMIGAVTARKQTKQNKEQEMRDFQRALYDNNHRTGSVTVYLKSISNPSIEISCFKREEKEICTLINAIIAVTNSK